MAADPSPDVARTTSDRSVGLPYRSYLFVPGSNERRLEKALQLDADAILVDLEDAVAPDEKPRARALLTEWLDAGAATSGRPIFVRVNLGPEGVPAEDLLVACRSGIEGIFIPKVEDADAVGAIDEVVSELERERGLEPMAFVVLLETARGVLDVREIVARSPRIRAAAVGIVDLMADVRADGSDLLLDWTRAFVALASRAAGLGPPIDTVFLDIGDTEGLVDAAQRARRDGYFGKLLIHPSQVGPVNAVFTPSEADVAAAVRLLEAYEAAIASGEGALVVDGRLVDRASVRAARTLVRLTHGSG
jgi:citrate lyase subunit beta/citryl-CoA lyase